MKLKPQLLLFPILLILSVGMQSCDKKPESQSQNLVLEPEKSYAVGIKTQGYETKGKIKFDQNGNFYFINEAPESTLFGMEEWVVENKLKVKYKDMEWTSDDVETETVRLYKALSLLFKTNSKKTIEDSINGNAVLGSLYKSENAEVILWVKKTDKTPVKITATESGRAYEINF